MPFFGKSGETRPELTQTVSLLRYAYGIQATVGLIYVPLVGSDGRFIDVGRPTVTFGLLDGLDTNRVHACEFDVIHVPEGYIVDRGCDGRLRLYDEQDNPCTVTCEEMSSQSFTVSSALRTFEAPLAREFSQVASTRDQNGNLRYDDRLALRARSGGAGYTLCSRSYPKPSPAVQARLAEIALQERRADTPARESTARRPS